MYAQSLLISFFVGAGDASRTRDLVLGRHPLYRLSYSRILSPVLYGCGPLRVNLQIRSLQPKTSVGAGPRACPVGNTRTLQGGTNRAGTGACPYGNMIRSHQLTENR